MANISCRALRSSHTLLSQHALPASVTSWNSFSTSSPVHASNHYPLVIVGAGSGGTAVANSFAKYLGKGKVAVIEPSTTHYYQPMWTLVGAGLKKFEQTQSSTGRHLPEQCVWIRDKVVNFDPDLNSVTLCRGDEVSALSCAVKCHLAICLKLQRTISHIDFIFITRKEVLCLSISSFFHLIF